MKMKVATLFLAMLLLVSTVYAAELVPFPINGKVSGFSGTLQVSVTNLRTGAVMSTFTNPSGEWLVDWSNSGSSKMEGDSFRISVDDCSERAECVVTVVYSGQPSIYAAFDITGVFNAPSGCPACYEGTAYDPTPYSLEGCQSVVKCPVQEVPPEAKDWTAILISGIISALVGLVAGIGGGLKAYKNAAGSVTLLHKHRGITEYHDVNTLHSKPAYRHRRFKDDPLGFAKDVKIINEQGGL